MLLNACNLKQPNSSLDTILETLFNELFHDSHVVFPPSIELSFKVTIPFEFRKVMKEYIPKLFKKYGFEVIKLEDQESEGKTIIYFK